jgi:hypothetical protein
MSICVLCCQQHRTVRFAKFLYCCSLSLCLLQLMHCTPPHPQHPAQGDRSLLRVHGAGERDAAAVMHMLGTGFSYFFASFHALIHVRSRLSAVRLMSERNVFGAVVLAVMSRGVTAHFGGTVSKNSPLPSFLHFLLPLMQQQLIRCFVDQPAKHVRSPAAVVAAHFRERHRAHGAAYNGFDPKSRHTHIDTLSSWSITEYAFQEQSWKNRIYSQ